MDGNSPGRDGGGRRLSRRAVLAAALGGGLAALAGPACFSRGSKGTPTGTPAGSLTPERTSSPGPSPSPAPAAFPELTRDDAAWEKLTYRANQPIDLPAGAFFMSTATGQVEGWRLRGDGGAGFPYYQPSPGNRFVMMQSNQRASLLDRRTGAAWSWPAGYAAAVLLPPNVVALVKTTPLQSGGWVAPADATVVLFDESVREVGRWRTAGLGAALLRIGPIAPDGSVAYASPESNVLLELDLRSGAVREFTRASDLSPVAGPSISARHYHPATGEVDALVITPPADKSGQEEYELVRLDRSGSTQARFSIGPYFLALRVERSPDGTHYTASGTYRAHHVAHGDNEDWIYTDLRRASSGEPVFRARSASLNYGDALGYRHWLADSSGFLAMVQGTAGTGTTTEWLTGRQYAVIGIDGSVKPLGGGFEDSYDGPVPSPDNPALVSIGRTGFKNLATGLVVRAPLKAGLPGHLDPWGLDSKELRFALPHGGHGGSGALTILPLGLERPPFSPAPSFQVARAGDCVNLREFPGLDAQVLDCLVDGTPLELAPGDDPPGYLWPGGGPVALDWRGDQAFIRVRAQSGREGWVAMQYLDWV